MVKQFEWWKKCSADAHKKRALKELSCFQGHRLDVCQRRENNSPFIDDKEHRGKNQFVSLLVGPLRDAFIKNKLISKLNLIMMTTTGGDCWHGKKASKLREMSVRSLLSITRGFSRIACFRVRSVWLPPIPIVEEKLMEIFCLNFAVVGGTR